MDFRFIRWCDNETSTRSRENMTKTIKTDGLIFWWRKLPNGETRSLTEAILADRTKKTTKSKDAV